MTGREWRRSGHIDIGWSDSSGNADVSRLHGDPLMIAAAGKNRYTAGLGSTTATDHGTEQNRTVWRMASPDRFLNQKWYAYASSTFEHDSFKDISSACTLGFGSGYQPIASRAPTWRWKVVWTMSTPNYYTTPNDKVPALRIGGAMQSLSIPDKLPFFFSAGGVLRLESVKKSFARAAAWMRMPMTAISLRPPSTTWHGWGSTTGLTSMDRTLLFTLGYKW